MGGREQGVEVFTSSATGLLSGQQPPPSVCTVPRVGPSSAGQFSPTPVTLWSLREVRVLTGAGLCASPSFVGPLTLGPKSFLQVTPSFSLLQLNPFGVPSVFRAPSVTCAFGSPQRSKLKIKGRVPSKASQFTLSQYHIWSLSWSVTCLQWS